MTNNKSAKSAPEDGLAFGWHLLAPKYWLFWLLVLFLYVVHLMPRRGVVALGRFLGRRMMKGSAKRRGIVATNLALCFPALSDQQRDDMLHRHFEYFGIAVIDMPLIWFASEKRLRRLVTCHGVENYQRHAGPAAPVLFTPHVLGIDMGGALVAMLAPGVAMMKRDKNPLLTWLLRRGRSRFNDAIVALRSDGMRPVLRALKKGRLYYLMPDEDFGEADYTVYAPFFGVERATLTILARICRITKGAALPCTTVFNEQTLGYDLYIGETLVDFPSKDDQRNAQQMNDAMQAMIMRAPEQYMWTFKWFRTRPNGEPSPY